MYIYGGEGGDARLLLASDEGDDHIDTYEIRAQASGNSLAIYQFESGSYVQRFLIDNGGKIVMGNSTTSTTQLDIRFSDTTTYSATSNHVNGLKIFNDCTTDNGFAGIELAATDADDYYGSVLLKAIADGTNYSNDFVIQTRHSGNHGERLRIDSSGKSYFMSDTSGGTNTTTLPNGHTVNINTKTSSDGLSVIRYSGSYGPYAINIGRSKSDTLGTNSLVADGDDLGHITWYGADGSDFNQAAAITVQVDGTPSNGTDMPGRILFKTTPDGSGTPAERLRINSDGSYYFLGDSSNNTRLRLLSDGAITGGSGANDVSLEFASGQSNNLASEGAQIRYDNSNGKLHISTTYNSSDSDIRFYTRTGAIDSTSNLRMNIMGDGYVMTPSQPSFRATKSGGPFNTGGGTIVFDQNQHNIGSNYNTSNGRFTAPVTGTYIFHYYSIYQGNSSNDVLDFYKNGGSFAGSRMHYTHGGVGSAWDNIVNSQILTLNENDYVEIYASDQTLHGGDWCHFCGHLLG